MSIEFGKVYSLKSRLFGGALLVQLKPSEDGERKSSYDVVKAMGLDSKGVRDSFYTFVGTVQKDEDFKEATEAQLVQWKQQFGGM